MPAANDLKTAWVTGAERYNRSLREWLNRVDQTIHDCLGSPNSTPEQKRMATAMQGLVTSYRMCCDKGDADTAAHEAFQLGMFHEVLRFAPFVKPARHGLELGCHWRGLWVKLAPQECRIVELLHDKAEVCLDEFVRHVWGELYNATYRTRYDKALSNINRKFADNSPPILVTFHIRDTRVIVESFA